jgi:hypothetical protein
MSLIASASPPKQANIDILDTCKSKKPSVLKLRLSEYNIYFPCAKTSILYLGVSCLETGRTVIPQINTILSQRSLLKIQKYPSTRTKVIAHKPLPIKKLEDQWAEPVSLTFHSVLRKLYKQTSIDASYQVSVHLAKRFQRRRFFKNGSG